jgi:hypothetical protein
MAMLIVVMVRVLRILIVMEIMINVVMENVMLLKTGIRLVIFVHVRTIKSEPLLTIHTQIVLMIVMTVQQIM